VSGDHPSVLFVCTGNICRSPFAEAAARRAYPHIIASSAGTYAVVGGQATHHMQEVAGERGLDLSNHRARQLEEVPQPDFVYGMEQHHLIEARKAFPDLAPGRIRLLAHPLAVPDPYGRGIEVYRSTASQIVDAVAALDL
jgi:protein-tyrosine-phosphatase